MKNNKVFAWAAVLFVILTVGAIAYAGVYRKPAPQNDALPTGSSIPDQVSVNQADIEIIAPKGGDSLVNNQPVDIQYAISDALKQKITSSDKAELYMLDSNNVLVGYIGTFDVNRTTYPWYADRLYHNGGLDSIIKAPQAGQYRILAIVRPRIKPTCTACDPGVDTLDSPNTSFSNGKLYYFGKLHSIQPTTSDVSDTFTIKDGPADPSGSSVHNFQGKYIHLSDIVSYRYNGTFHGNDPIEFSWYSNYPTVSPVFYLANTQTTDLVYSKVLGAGSQSSSAKFGEGTPANMNLATGLYRLELCDTGVKDFSGLPLCVSKEFSVIATTTPYQP